MAFNPNAYKPTISAKSLPVVLLLDVSGSMSGEKINKLYDAVVKMVDVFVDQRAKETMIKVAIITFGASVDLHTPYTDVEELQKCGINQFYANGMTPLGCALRMAKDMIDDKDTTPPKEMYAPAVVLVSDGQPNDNWREYFNAFVNGDSNGRRTVKCQRFSVAIGNDADTSMLKNFASTGEDGTELMYYADSADQIVEAFKNISITISRTSSNIGKSGMSNSCGRSFDSANAEGRPTATPSASRSARSSSVFSKGTASSDDDYDEDEY